MLVKRCDAALILHVALSHHFHLLSLCFSDFGPVYLQAREMSVILQGIWHVGVWGAGVRLI